MKYEPTDVAIEVQHLSKQYILGESIAQLSTLREKIAATFKAPFQKLKKLKLAPEQPKTETLWALNDVSFEVKHGEVVGIIGHNGAGKSTLLKILSQITEPTMGRIIIRGRVGSLLEVGTGFHPELTGRENIFLNGAILGMRQNEIRQKFDEIVAFAEIEKFLETPVKRYSSGMYIRLAFAVAAHLEPELLLVDEVLAVGDVNFQKKCLGKMSDVAHSGRTVLFVSHNMGAISQLCDRTILLDKGQVVKIGPTYDVIHEYLDPHAATPGVWHNSEMFQDNTAIKLLSASIISEQGTQKGVVRFDENFQIGINYKIVDFIKSPWTMVFRVSNSSGAAVFTSWDIDSINQEKPQMAGKYCATCYIPGKLLRPGTYSVGLGIYYTNTNMHTSSFREHLFYFEVSSIGYTMNPNRGGVITPVLKWSVTDAA